MVLLRNVILSHQIESTKSPYHHPFYGKGPKERNLPHARKDLLNSGSEKGVFWKRGLFNKKHVLEILENLENLEILENPKSVENRGESDHFLEIPENLEISEIPEVPPAKRPLS